MAEFETCDKCKYSTKMSDEFPCNSCVHGVCLEDFFKPKTNADRIRSMSDEELAEFLSHYMSCGYCDARNKEQGCKDCKAELLQWLKSEAKE